MEGPLEGLRVRDDRRRRLRGFRERVVLAGLGGVRDGLQREAHGGPVAEVDGGPRRPVAEAEVRRRVAGRRPGRARGHALGRVARVAPPRARGQYGLPERDRVAHARAGDAAGTLVGLPGHDLEVRAVVLVAPELLGRGFQTPLDDERAGPAVGPLPQRDAAQLEGPRPERAAPQQRDAAVGRDGAPQIAVADADVEQRLREDLLRVVDEALEARLDGAVARRGLGGALGRRGRLGRGDERLPAARERDVAVLVRAVARRLGVRALVRLALLLALAVA